MIRQRADKSLLSALVRLLGKDAEAKAGTWDVFVSMSDRDIWSYVCYNLNDIADYFGIDRTLKIMDENNNYIYAYWAIS